MAAGRRLSDDRATISLQPQPSLSVWYQHGPVAVKGPVVIVLDGGKRILSCFVFGSCCLAAGKLLCLPSLYPGTTLLGAVWLLETSTEET